MLLVKRQPTSLTPKAWKRALIATKNAIKDKDLTMLGAGVAYYATIAFFPTVAAFVSLYALFASPSQVTQLGMKLDHSIPQALSTLITSQLAALSNDSKRTIVGAVIAIALALFSASSGVQNLIKALNRTFGVDERRKGIKLRLISLAFMLGFIVIAFPVLGLIFIQPSYLIQLGLNHDIAIILGILRWVLLLGLITVTLAAVFRYAPDRREPRWSIVSWGGAAATIVWFIGTILFFIYVQYFASFNKTYGVFAGLIVLMTWLNLSAFIILLGAEVNHHLENEVEPHQRLRRLNPKRLFARKTT